MKRGYPKAENTTFWTTPFFCPNTNVEYPMDWVLFLFAEFT